MPYCTNCGKELADGAKFCFECGSAVNATVQQNSSNRKTVYDGEIHKCPNCGEVIGSFAGVCPSCGYEFRGSIGVTSVRVLASKLEALESQRKPTKKLFGRHSLTQIDEQKVSLIRSFVIPNTKEDLYEFLVLAGSNIEVDLYDESKQYLRNSARFVISEAWRAKFEQAYEKSKLVFGNDSRLKEIQLLYSAKQKSLKRARWKTWKTMGILWGIFFAFLAIIFIILALV